MHEFYSIIKSFKEHLVTIYASNAPLLVFCYKKQNKNTIKAKIQAAWHQSTWLMRYISSPVKSHVNVWPKIRATFKFYTHYFPLRWSSNIICASGWMFVVGWPRINFFMEKSSLNVLLNVFPVVSNRWQGFRLGFLRWTIPLNCFSEKYSCYRGHQQHSRFSIKDLLFSLMQNAHCACDLVGKHGPEIPGRSAKGPNALVPLQWVHSWIRHDPYSHTTQARPIERHVFRGRKVCWGLTEAKTL